MDKFKKGDRIRVTLPNSSTHSKNGALGTVDRREDAAHYSVTLDDEVHGRWYKSDSLELAAPTFAVGDDVVVVHPASDFNGLYGRVVSIDIDNEFPVKVQFNRGGHGSFRPENLEHQFKPKVESTGTQRFIIGEPVMITQTGQYNGRHGHIENIDPRSEYSLRVRFEGGDSIWFHPQHVQHRVVPKPEPKPEATEFRVGDVISNEMFEELFIVTRIVNANQLEACMTGGVVSHRLTPQRCTLVYRPSDV